METDPSMLSCQYPSFSLSPRESQGLLNRAVCMDAGDSWGGLIKTPFYRLGRLQSVTAHTHPHYPPGIHVCLTGLWGKQISRSDWPEGKRGNNQPTSETVVCKLAVFWSKPENCSLGQSLS